MEEIKPSLDFQDEIALHKKGWIIQRIGWGLMIVLVLAASLGLFGTGVLANVTKTVDDSVIKYERFVRFGKPMNLRIETVPVDGKIVVALPLDYLMHVELERIVPKPEVERIRHTTVEFVFNASDDGKIKFYLVPEKVGKVATQLRVNQSDFIINHFVYP